MFEQVAQELSIRGDNFTPDGIKRYVLRMTEKSAIDASVSDWGADLIRGWQKELLVEKQKNETARFEKDTSYKIANTQREDAMRTLKEKTVREFLLVVE